MWMDSVILGGVCGVLIAVGAGIVSAKLEALPPASATRAGEQVPLCRAAMAAFEPAEAPAFCSPHTVLVAVRPR